MVAEPLPAGADPSRSRRGAITQATVEHAFAISVGAAAAGFGGATIPSMLGQLGDLDPVAGVVVAIAVYAALCFVAISALVWRLAASAQRVLAIVFLVALATWPWTVHGALPAGQVPWLWWLCNVATGAAAISMPVWAGGATTLIVSVLYSCVRVMESGGAVSVERAVLDGVYVAILGGALLVLVVALRRAAHGVDSAQAIAMARYASVIQEHATEVERVQVDAIVHDSVLTVLLAAARADTADAKQLAVTMARRAVEHLGAASSTGPGDDAPVPVNVLRDRIVTGVRALAAPIEITAVPGADVMLPKSVSEALVSATLQAALNSVQHAGSDNVLRWVEVTVPTTGSVRVEVGDTGAGFDLQTVPSERLGVRRSILERVASAGGDAVIRTTPGTGTRVVLTWPGAPGRVA